MKRKNHHHAKNHHSPYTLSCYMKEAETQPIFGVNFNPHLQASGHYVFATASSNRISIYECVKDGSINLLQAYSDPDNEESFYAVAWTYCDRTNNPLLAAAGARGIIRIISTADRGVQKSFKGHGHSINDLKFHPQDHNLLLSVSKDLSLRIWNIQKDICVAIFGGVEGHRDEVLSADFNLAGTRIVSCGMDHSLKIWALDTPEIQEAMRLSYEYDYIRAPKPFRTARCQIPAFTTRDIHRNYVDCVRWYGNFILSKSCENAIVLWKPGKLENQNDILLGEAKIQTESNTTQIHQFNLTDSEIWFMRFATDQRMNTIALGNMKGKTYLWDLDPEDISASKPPVILQHPKCTYAIRQPALSNDGSILICVSDDGGIWRWDRERPESDNASTKSTTSTRNSIDDDTNSIS